MSTSTLRRIVPTIALITASAIALAACSSAAATPSESGSDAAAATSVADFGTFADLEAAAKAEGKLNVIALPRDWANYGEIIDAFKKKYPEIEVTEQSPDVSSAEEIQAATTNAGLDTAPDVFDLGLTVALQNTDKFAAYKVQTFDEIPDALKEPTGLFVGDYGGYMSVGYDSSSPSRRRSPTSSAPTTRARSRSTATRRRPARSPPWVSRRCRTAARWMTSSRASTSSPTSRRRATSSRST
jgi:putative spermidine/putrescine transport system substrate-binding protein